MSELRPRSPLPPPDPQLPGASLLFDADRLRGVLQESPQAKGPGPGGPLEQLAIRYLDYQPGGALTVQYRATIDGHNHDLTATLHRSAQASVPATGDLLEGATLAWYPHDPGLPALAWPADRLAGELGCAELGPLERLAWVPGRRATLASPTTVIKCYSDPAEAEIACRAMDIVADVPTARLIAARTDLGIVAQQRLGGRPLARADAYEAAGAAGGLLCAFDTIAGLAADQLPMLGPHDYLDAVRGPVGLVGVVCPELQDRLACLLARLVETAPSPANTVVSHGDFNIGQLIAQTDGLAVIDVDTLCRAPRGLDVASYAANLISGRANDLAEANAAMRELIHGYGREPDAVDWYLAAVVLRRADRPFRRLKRRWLERTTQLVDAAEVLVTRLG